MTSKILVYRLGSLGDTVVALPCFHLIRRKFPNAQIRVLTNAPVTNAAPRLTSVLGNSGLIDGHFEYPLATKNPRVLLALARDIRAWGPKTAIYISGRCGLPKILRDTAFLRLCGIRKFSGLPLRRDLRELRPQPDGLVERECERLARCVSALGDANVHDRANWDLRLSQDEIMTANQVITEKIGLDPFIIVSIGTKKAGYDWGASNWQRLIELLLPRYRHKLVFIGADSDKALSDTLARQQPQRFVNLCGKLQVRESAALISRASLFVGHDSGPMHLASAVGTPLVAVFSNLNKPGAWFPFGENVRILYPRDPDKAILSIQPADALAAIDSLMATSGEEHAGSPPFARLSVTAR